MPGDPSTPTQRAKTPYVSPKSERRCKQSCERCRARKAKCTADRNDGSPCSPCLKAKENCSWPRSSATRVQKSVKDRSRATAKSFVEYLWRWDSELTNLLFERFETKVKGSPAKQDFSISPLQLPSAVIHPGQYSSTSPPPSLLPLNPPNISTAAAPEPSPQSLDLLLHSDSLFSVADDAMHPQSSALPWSFLLSPTAYLGAALPSLSPLPTLLQPFSSHALATSTSSCTAGAAASVADADSIETSSFEPATATTAATTTTTVAEELRLEDWLALDAPDATGLGGDDLVSAGDEGEALHGLGPGPEHGVGLNVEYDLALLIGDEICDDSWWSSCM